MKLKEKQKARKLRAKGYTIARISAMLGVAKSSVSLWVRDQKLSDYAKKRITAVSDQARLKAIQNRKMQRHKLESDIMQRLELEIHQMELYCNPFSKLACALLFWAEGGKTDRSLMFMNSDPHMIRAFLKLLRLSFELDESKFRVCLHLHSYHNKAKQTRYWAEITSIPVKQFIKPYSKKNTGKRKKEGYQGCASLRYHDYKVAMELKLLYTLFAQKYGRVV